MQVANFRSKHGCDWAPSRRTALSDEGRRFFTFILSFLGSESRRLANPPDSLQIGHTRWIGTFSVRSRDFFCSPKQQRLLG
jgi:hypothetical protein